MDVLRPLDLVVALKLHTLPPNKRTYQGIATELGISVSQAHKATHRAAEARLLRGVARKEDRALRTRPVLPFLTHGVRFAFFPIFGPDARGVPTGVGALGPTELIGGKPVVWPFAAGKTWGRALEPLDKCVPAAATRDPAFHRSLALLDTLRTGGARERDVAGRLLAEHLTPGAQDDSSST